MGEPSSFPGLYLHLPFCAGICPYCDFAVLVGDEVRRQGFVEALIAELALAGDAAGGPAPPQDGQTGSGHGPPEGGGPPRVDGFDTIYLGGGTPSMLAVEQLERILRAVAERLELAGEPWIFLEANPEDVTPERLAAWRRLGVRTLSLGVQSFEAGELRFLGRAHTPEQARRSLELALAAGFATVSADLIYALPGQSAAGWRRQLEIAAGLGAQHLSCYQLTIHSETAFGVRRQRGELDELSDGGQAELFLATHRRLTELGFDGYEVSNFARGPEHRSRHNRKYWDHTPYLGVGPSAHSYAAGRRWWNHRALGRWQQEVARGRRPLAGCERLDRRQLALERLMLGLRTREGVDLDLLAERYGLDPRSGAPAALERHMEGGRLRLEGARLRPTLEGLLIADSLARDLQD